MPITAIYGQSATSADHAGVAQARTEPTTASLLHLAPLRADAVAAAPADTGHSFRLALMTHILICALTELSGRRNGGVDLPTCSRGEDAGT